MIETEWGVGDRERVWGGPVPPARGLRTGGLPTGGGEPVPR